MIGHPQNGLSRIAKQKLSIALLTLLILLAGCGPKPLMPETALARIQDPGLTSELNQAICHQYPNRFKAVHHVALTLFGETYVLNGYLTVNRLERQLHLIAQNDMGGTLFEIHIEGVETHIQSKTKILKTSWLENSVVKDLETLYLPPPLSSPELSLGQDNTLLLSENQGEISREYLFKKEPSQQNNYKLMEYKYIKNNKEIYAINYIYDEKNIKKHPSFIAIEDHSLNYQLKINSQYYFTPMGTAETKD
jgi:hypothetical protein